MLAYKYTLVGALLFYTIQLPAEIHIVCTAALIDAQAAYRQQEYINSIQIIKQLGYDPYIIESCKKKGPTFLNEYSNHVFYSTANNPALKNKGVNEGKTLLQGLKSFKFADEDMIIKLTGRYYFISDYLIKTILKNPEIDGFFLFIASHNQVVTGCFAMRYKQLITMLENFKYESMELNMINIEWEVAQYLQNNDKKYNLRILYVNKLDIAAKVFGDGNTNLNEMSLLSW